LHTIALFRALPRYDDGMKEHRNLISLREAVTKTGVARRTFQDWLRDGKITGYTVAGDRQRYLDRAELDRLLQPQPLPKPRRRKT
jgi:excisionase family DNA binding protein